MINYTPSTLSCCPVHCARILQQNASVVMPSVCQGSPPWRLYYELPSLIALEARYWMLSSFLPSWTLQQTLYILSPAGSTKLDVWGPRKPQLCYGISPDFSNNIAYIRINITLDIYGNLFKHSLILSLSDPWTSTIFSSSCPHHILRFRLA